MHLKRSLFYLATILLLIIITGCQSDPAPKSQGKPFSENPDPASPQIQAIRTAPDLKSEPATQTNGRKFERKQSHGDLGTTTSDTSSIANTSTTATQADQQLTTGTAGITGIVRLYPDNTPLHGAAISVQLHGTTQSLLTTTSQATTSADGTFKLQQLPAVPIDLKVVDANGKPLYAAPGQPDDALSPKLADNQTTAITLTLFAGYKIQGTVYDKDTSEPLSGATLSIAESNLPATTSDANGHYHFEGVGPDKSGAAKIFVKLSGFVLSAIPNISKSDGQAFAWISLPGNTDSASQDFPMVPSLHVSGRIENEQGEPIGGANLEWQSSVYAAQNAKTVSRADGTFLVESIPFQEAMIDVTAPGYAFYRSKEAIRIMAADIENVKIVLLQGATAEGRVANGKGEGIEGASITVADSILLNYSSWNSTRHLARSGSGGYFKIESLDPGTNNLTAGAEGYSPGMKTVNAKPGEQVTGVEILLPDELTVEGRVEDVDGKPLKARVSTSAGQGAPVTTDADGHFKLGRLKPGKVDLYAVSFSPQRSKTASATAGDKDVVIRMDADFVVHGKVLDAVTKQPINDYEIGNVGQIWKDGEGPNGFRFHMTVGDFSIPVKITSEGYPAQTFDVKSKHDTSDVNKDFELGTGGSIRGRIVSAKDKMPMATIPVSAKAYSAGNDTPNGRTYTAADGTFLIAGLPSGSTQVTASPELPMVPNSKTVQIVNGETAEVGDIEIGEPGSINGQVTDAVGKPVVDTKVSLMFPMGVRSQTGQWQTDNDGRFEIADLDPGIYAIIIGTSNIQFHKTTVDAGHDTDVVIRLGGITLQGTVTHEGPPVNASISVTNIASGIDVTGSVKAGQFSITDLTPGKVKVSISVMKDSSLLQGWTTTEEVATEQFTIPDQPTVTHDFVITGPLPEAPK